MAVSYETDSRLKALKPVLDEHAEWFGAVIRCLMYPEAPQAEERLAQPGGFLEWANDASLDNTFSRSALEELTLRFEQLHEAGRILLNKCREGRKPTLDEFDVFVNLYEGFVVGVRRLEHDSAFADIGVDPLTGLRSQQAMKKDLETELERLSRRGKPFCLIISRIDHFARFSRILEEEQVRQILIIVSGLIKKCLRTFDDAYRLDNGEFVMSLKQTEMTGGSAAVERLRKMIDAENIVIQDGGEAIPLRMSFCVAEPLPGDTFTELLQNMSADLHSYMEKGDTALEFIEQSPLQRYVKSSTDR
jgi:diguanylate cyclase (GGDEF)-like protein